MPRRNTVVHPCREEIIYSNSRVHELKDALCYHPDLLLQTTISKLIGSGLPSSQGVEEDISEALIIVNYYNLLLYNVAASSAALLLMLCI